MTRRGFSAEERARIAAVRNRLSTSSTTDLVGFFVAWSQLGDDSGAMESIDSEKATRLRDDLLSLDDRGLRDALEITLRLADDPRAPESGCAVACGRWDFPCRDRAHVTRTLRALAFAGLDARDLS